MLVVHLMRVVMDQNMLTTRIAARDTTEEDVHLGLVADINIDALTVLSLGMGYTTAINLQQIVKETKN